MPVSVQTNKMRGTIGRALGWRKPHAGEQRKRPGPDPEAGPRGEEKPSMLRLVGRARTPASRGAVVVAVACRGRARRGGNLEIFLWEPEPREVRGLAYGGLEGTPWRPREASVLTRPLR